MRATTVRDGLFGWRRPMTLRASRTSRCSGAQRRYVEDLAGRPPAGRVRALDRRPRPHRGIDTPSAAAAARASWPCSPPPTSGSAGCAATPCSPPTFDRPAAGHRRRALRGGAGGGRRRPPRDRRRRRRRAGGGRLRAAPARAVPVAGAPRWRGRWAGAARTTCSAGAEVVVRGPLPEPAGGDGADGGRRRAGLPDPDDRRRRCCGRRPSGCTTCATRSPTRSGSTGQLVRVRAPQVGGGFGGKFEPAPEAWSSPRWRCGSGEPVAWTQTRTENLQCMPHGRGQLQERALGARRDGTFVGIWAEITADAGAYPPSAP